MNRCPFDFHPTKKRTFICLDCGAERKQLDDEPGPEVVNRSCGNAKIRLGDVVHLLANRIGFKEEDCGRCPKRHRLLNKIDRKLRNKLAAGWEAMSRLGRGSP